MCHVEATDVTEDPVRLRHVFLPKLEKCKAFKASSVGMVMNGSVIGDGGATGAPMDYLVSFLKIWAARKAAAEALERFATVEINDLGEYKAKSLKIFKSKKCFDLCIFFKFVLSLEVLKV